MLGMNKIQRLLPAHPDKLILSAYALRAIRRGQKAFSHHRVAHAGLAMNLVPHGGLQRVCEGGFQRAAGGEDIFTIGFNQHRSPMGRGEDGFSCR